MLVSPDRTTAATMGFSLSRLHLQSRQPTPVVRLNTVTCQYSTSPAAPYPLTQLRWCKLTSSSLTYLSFSYYQLPLDPASSLYTLQRRLITVAVAITPTAKIGTCRLTTGSLSPQRRLSTVSAFRHADERLGEYPQNHARTAPTSGGTNQQ